MRTLSVQTAPSPLRRLKIWLAPEPDIELGPDRRSAETKLYDFCLFSAAIVFLVPWLIIVAALFVAVEGSKFIVQLLD